MLCTICESTHHAAYSCPQRDRRGIAIVSAGSTRQAARVDENANRRHVSAGLVPQVSLSEEAESAAL